MKPAGAKGTVTSLSSLFPAEEARKASQRVQETIGERRQELDKVHHFIADNTNLINLVQRLPDELDHQIMVPFGSAAFFPGRLVHTNEFTVLLGEGYYAERTAKQTVDILKRRGKTLDSQVDSLTAVIEDLKTEASFFDRTAAEAAEGLLEIREDYTDEDSVGSGSESGRFPVGNSQDLEKSSACGVSEVNSGDRAVDDEEYARIMSRFDELEREELEAEDTEEQEDDELDRKLAKLDVEHSKDQCHVKEVSNISQPNDADKLNLQSFSLQSGNRDESSRGKDLMQSHVPKRPEKNDAPSILKSSVQSSTKVKSEVPIQLPKADAGSRISKPTTDSLKAFTGSIVERTDNLQLNPEKPAISQPSSSQPSRPVSRFKMRRM